MTDVEIEHYYIDLRMLNWKNRIDQVMCDKDGYCNSSGHDSNDINEFYISNLMVKVIEKTGNDVQNFKVIKNVID